MTSTPKNKHQFWDVIINTCAHYFQIHYNSEQNIFCATIK